MSQGPRRLLRLENVDGVTVVSFVDTKIVTEEQIQEVLPSQPPRKACVSNSGQGRGTRIARDELLHRRDSAQFVSEREASGQKEDREWDSPQDTEPSFPDANLRHDAAAGRDPMAQPDAVVGVRHLLFKRISEVLRNLHFEKPDSERVITLLIGQP